MAASLHSVYLGTVAYADAFALQRAVHAARVAKTLGDTLLLLQHPPTITHHHAGKGLDHLLASPERLASLGVLVQPTDRGGDITVHGPGQLVGYPIVALDEDGRDLHAYLRRVEQVLIEVADDLGVPTARVPGRTGTWTTGETPAKLAAIGVKASRWVTMHGFALNLTTDLSLFELIVPCGIADAGVTSVARELGAAPPSMESVASLAAARFAQVFERSPSPAPDLLRMLCAASGNPCPLVDLSPSLPR